MDFKKRKTGKARPGFVRGSWRSKVNPIFVAWWSSHKKNLALGKVRDRTEFDRKFLEWKKEAGPVSRAFNEAQRQIKEPFGGPLLAEIAKGMETEGPSIIPLMHDAQEAIVSAESSPFFRRLVFLKYGITFRQLIWKIDVEKGRAAHRKLMAVHRDYWRFKTEVRPDLKLKFNWEQFSIITQGLDFGLGELTAEELADCLNEICPCGLKHSPEYFKKVRTAIRQACSRYRDM